MIFSNSKIDTPSDIPSNVPSLSNAPSDSPSTFPSLSQNPSSMPSNIPSTSSVPSSNPSSNPVPGCSGDNDGSTNYCINPNFDENSPKNGYLTDKGETAFNLVDNLGLCEGNCDTNCADGLVCVAPDTDGNVRGCSGLPLLDYKYCAYPVLTNKPDNNGVDLSTFKESFLRVTDDGSVEIYAVENDLSISSNQYLVWNREGTFSQNPTAESLDFEHDFDLSRSTARDIFFVGDYGHADLKVDLVESEESGLHVKTSEVNVYGTTSKVYEFASPIDVDFNSMVSLKVTLGTGVKALALCMDDDVRASTGSDGRVKNNCLALGGTSVDEIFENYLSPGTTATVEDSTEVTFPLWQMYSSREPPVKYLGIIQIVNENDVSVTESLIQDLRFYQENNRRLNTGSTLCTCGPTELASTLTPGLHHNCVNSGDFCSPAKDKLLEITKNENDSCSSHSECRSGICQNDKCASKVRHFQLKTNFPFQKYDHTK